MRTTPSFSWECVSLKARSNAYCCLTIHFRPQSRGWLSRITTPLRFIRCHHPYYRELPRRFFFCFHYISQVTQICVSSFQFYFTQMLLYKVQYQLHVLIPQSFVIFSKQLKSFSYSILIFYTTFHIIFASMVWAMFPCPQWFTFFIFLIRNFNELYIIFS